MSGVNNVWWKFDKNQVVLIPYLRALRALTIGPNSATLIKLKDRSSSSLPAILKNTPSVYINPYVQKDLVILCIYPVHGEWLRGSGGLGAGEEGSPSSRTATESTVIPAATPLIAN